MVASGAAADSSTSQGTTSGPGAMASATTSDGALAGPTARSHSTSAIRPSKATLISRLNQEIQTVLALIQQNSAWSGNTNPLGLRFSTPSKHLVQLVPNSSGDALGSHGAEDAQSYPQMYAVLDHDEDEEAELVGEELVALELRMVRSQMFSWPDWSVIDPLTYLMPFLYAIRSPLSSTPVTAAALLSVHSILTTGFFTTETEGAALAMHVLVDSVTSCRFEVRDVVSEEVVLMRILNVLLACLQCPAAPLLSDRAVCTVVNTCFRVLHQSAAKGELLQRMAAQVMREMIRTIFVSLPACAAAEAAAGLLAEAQEEEDEEEEEENGGAGPLSPLVSSTREEFGGRSFSAERKPLLASLSRGSQDSAGKSLPRREGTGEEDEDDEEVPEEDDEDDDDDDDVEEEYKKQPVKQLAEQEQEQGQGQGQAGDQEPQVQQQKGVLVEVGRPQGMSCMVEIFQFLCSLLSVEDQFGAPLLLGGGASEVSTGEEDSNVPLFALQLISLSLELGGESMAQHPKLLILIQDSLMHSLLHMACTSPSLPMIALVCNTVLHLYLTLRVHLKLQLEAFLDFALVRLAQEKFSMGPQHQEVALEAMVDLCRLPTFAAEMYANFDCELSSSNTFEDVCTQLSRAAFPVSLPLNRLHVLALKGLLALLHHMSLRVDAGPAPKPPAPLSIKAQDPQNYQLLWTSKLHPPDASNAVEVQHWVDEVRKRKHIKRRLMMGAEQFNRDPARGLLYLQTYHLLPQELDPGSVACFLRFTPGVNKTVLGAFLGDHDLFKVDVLHHFVKLFDFSQMALDAALRIFLESFRLPGEAQKISRILEAFADRYFEQCRTILANKDAAFILSYSVIMLNTDQHNGQVRRKMTEEEFIRNNRSINNGSDLPRSMLSELYRSIQRDEIRVSSDVLPGQLDMSQSRWMEILRKGAMGATAPYVLCSERSPLLDYDMFSIIAGPTVAAISVVFDNAEEEEVLRQCVAGFLDAAKVCAAHCMRDTLDDLVVSLCKFTGLLQPGGKSDERGEDEDAVQQFAGDIKATLAAGAMFAIASRYGDYVRTGWRNILDCVLRLHKLGLLPARVLQEARDAWAGGQEEEEEEMAKGEDSQRGSTRQQGAPAPAGAAGSRAGSSAGAREGAGVASSRQAQAAAASSGASVQTTLSLSRALGIATGKKKGRGFMSRMSQLLLGGQQEEYEELPKAAQEAQRVALATVTKWHIEAIFADSKFLQADSLLHLAKALIWAATRAQGGNRGEVSPSYSPSEVQDEEKEDEDTAVFCLDLLFGVTLANRDRISLLWPAVAEHLSSIFVTATPPPSVLLEKAVLGMLQLCQRLLAYKEDVADELLRSLQLILKLDPELQHTLCQRVTEQVLLLVQSYCTAGAHAQSAAAWRTLFMLITASAEHPTAADVGLEAVRFVLGDKRHLTRTNFLPCVSLAIEFSVASAAGSEAQRRAVKSMELLGGLADGLIAWAVEEQKAEGGAGSGAAEADALVTGGGWVVVQRVTEGAKAGDNTMAVEVGGSGSSAGAEAGGGEVSGEARGGESGSERRDGSRLVDLWLRLVLATSRACAAEQREAVRQAGILSLECAVTAGRDIGVHMESWNRALEEGVFSLLDDLLQAATEAAEKKARLANETRAIDASLELALQLQCRAVLAAVAAPAAGAGAGAGPGASGPGARERQPGEREAGVPDDVLTRHWGACMENMTRYLNGPPEVPDEVVRQFVDSLLRPMISEAVAAKFLAPIPGSGDIAGARPKDYRSARWAVTWSEVTKFCPDLTPDALVMEPQNGEAGQLQEQEGTGEARAIGVPA